MSKPIKNNTKNYKVIAYKGYTIALAKKNLRRPTRPALYYCVRGSNLIIDGNIYFGDCLSRDIQFNEWSLLDSKHIVKFINNMIVNLPF